MHRNFILDKLYRYRKSYTSELEVANRFIEFIQEYKDCFERSLDVGHITGSCWLLSPCGSKVLLTHHKKLNKWLQLGGHSDGEMNTVKVAMTEAVEESGIEALNLVSEEIFDIDVHLIPANPKEGEHFHFDIRFLIKAEEEGFTVSDESHDLAWVPLAELESYTDEQSMLRMRDKSIGVTA